VSWIGDIGAIFSLRRISGQIAALILGSLVLIHALIAGYFLLHQPNPRPLADNPIQQFELFARVIVQTPRSDRGILLQNIERAFPHLQLRLIKKDAERVRPTANAEHVTVSSPLGQNVEVIRDSPAGMDRISLGLEEGELLEATISSPRMPAHVSGLWTTTLLFLFISITLLGVWAGRALSSPLSAFARAAESYSISQSSPPLPETGPEEIRAAAKALNRMRERITKLMNDRTQMLAAISHDLRTPVTRLRLRSEYIEDEIQRAQTLSDLDQMRSMLDSVLLLFRNGWAGKPTLVDVASLLEIICEQFTDLGHAVSYHGPDRAALTMRPDEINRAVTNLVENAVRFGTAVTVELAVSNNEAIIKVADNGPGIPDAQKAAVLEPFVRGDAARSMDERSGFGLGLSIAYAIVHAHGGTLTLRDNAPRGLLVKISLPNADTTSSSLNEPQGQKIP
jgi:signal transduction histidine kinase